MGPDYVITKPAELEDGISFLLQNYPDEGGPCDEKFYRLLSDIEKSCINWDGIGDEDPVFIEDGTLYRHNTPIEKRIRSRKLYHLKRNSILAKKKALKNNISKSAELKKKKKKRELTHNLKKNHTKTGHINT